MKAAAILSISIALLSADVARAQDAVPQQKKGYVSGIFEGVVVGGARRKPVQRAEKPKRGAPDSFAYPAPESNSQPQKERVQNRKQIVPSFESQAAPQSQPVSTASAPVPAAPEAGVPVVVSPVRADGVTEASSEIADRIRSAQTGTASAQYLRQLAEQTRGKDKEVPSQRVLPKHSVNEENRF